MNNLLTHPGLVHHKAHDRRSTRAVPNTRTEPIQSHYWAWIKTEKGIRRLVLKETRKGLGSRKEAKTNMLASILKCTTILFHWEYLLVSLILLASKEFSAALPTDNTWVIPEEPDDGGDDIVFNWTPPDLSVGEEWYNKRVATLWEAAATLPNNEAVVK